MNSTIYDIQGLVNSPNKEEIGVQTLVGDYTEAGSNHGRKYYQKVGSEIGPAFIFLIQSSTVGNLDPCMYKDILQFCFFI